MKRLDVPEGTRFEKLTIIREVEKSNQNRRQFLCKCDCGNEKIIPLADLRSGHSKSCGCKCSINRRLNAQDYIGKRFGKLVVIGEATQQKGERYKVKCKCNCGTIKDYTLLNLLNEKSPTRSCGCVRSIHDGIKNRSNESLYTTYRNMKNRCNNPKYKHYYNYGGRGIKICEEWDESYASFREWALNNGYNPSLTIDRIDNNGNYEPANCRWVDMKIQSNNTRRNRKITYNGETHTLTEWSEITGIKRARIEYHINKGRTLDAILARK